MRVKTIQETDSKMSLCVTNYSCHERIVKRLVATHLHTHNTRDCLHQETYGVLGGHFRILPEEPERRTQSCTLMAKCPFVTEEDVSKRLEKLHTLASTLCVSGRFENTFAARTNDVFVATSCSQVRTQEASSDTYSILADHESCVCCV